MRWIFGFVCVCALGMLPLVGCSDNNGGGGSGGSAGTGGTGGNGVACVDSVCPCTEAGILAAIAEGGARFTFDCDGTTRVVTTEMIVIDNDVILDGEGNLTVDGNEDHTVFWVEHEVTAELRGFTVTGGNRTSGGGILALGTLTLTNSTVSGNTAGREGGGGIFASGVLTLMNSTVSGNAASAGAGGILASGVTLTNSTVSGNAGYGISSGGTLTLTNSTVSGNTALGIYSHGDASVTNSVVDGDCQGDITSNGYNIESGGDTCGFDQPTDQVNVSAGDLNLGPLQDNGGPTLTHALGAGSVAIDAIPEADCVDADGAPLTTDQRGEPRPGGTMCDVGAFEVQP